jgi:hypothetical protein
MRIRPGEGCPAGIVAAVAGEAGSGAAVLASDGISAGVAGGG